MVESGPGPTRPALASLTTSVASTALSLWRALQRTSETTPPCAFSPERPSLFERLRRRTPLRPPASGPRARWWLALDAPAYPPARNGTPKVGSTPASVLEATTDGPSGAKSDFRGVLRRRFSVV